MASCLETNIRIDTYGHRCECAIQLLAEDEVERWEKSVIPVLLAEHEKADAENWRILRELGYEGK